MPDVSSITVSVSTHLIFRYHLPSESVGLVIELNFFDKNDIINYVNNATFTRGRLFCSGAQYGQKILKRVGNTEHFHRIHLISVVDPDPVGSKYFCEVGSGIIVPVRI
jgi:hypothetical protein